VFCHKRREARPERAIRRNTRDRSGVWRSRDRFSRRALTRLSGWLVSVLAGAYREHPRPHASIKHRGPAIRTNRARRGGGRSIWAEVESTFHLLEQARAGDQEALERLFARHLKPLQDDPRMVATWARDLADSDDRVHDTWPRLRAAPCRRGAGVPPSRGAQFAFFNELRRKGRQPPITDLAGIDVRVANHPSNRRSVVRRLSATRALQRLTAENGPLRALRVEQIRPQSRVAMA
jgi:hypothetical protein